MSEVKRQNIARAGGVVNMAGRADAASGVDVARSEVMARPDAIGDAGELSPTGEKR